MELTTHFTLDELTRSDAATRLNITEQFLPDGQVINNLRALCDKALEPIRGYTRTFIHINSGYRCQRLNKAIGGAPTSQHVLGEAADIRAQGYTTEQLYTAIKESGIEFDQLIQEFDRWVHISYRLGGNNRMECLRAVKENFKTVYKPD